MAGISISNSYGSIILQKGGKLQLIEIELSAGGDVFNVDLRPAAGYAFVAGTYHDLNPKSNVKLEVTTADGLGSVVTRSGSYRLGGVARFSIALVAFAVPGPMALPGFAGGAQSATLTLAAEPADGGSPITRYGYEVAAGDDVAFAAPVASGAVAAADRATPIVIAPLAAGDYTARTRAVNAIGGGAWSAAAAATVSEIPAAAVNTVAPVIGGTPRVGQTLTAAVGTWTNGPVAFAYQWRRDGVAIAGATAQTYVLGPEDDRATLSVTVTATNAGGATDAASAGVPVSYAAPVAAGTLADVRLVQGGGGATRDAGALFTNAVGGVWSVTVNGAADARVATISAAGVVTVLDGAPLDGAAVLATYANSGGSASRGFTATISAQTPAQMAAPALAGGIESATLTLAAAPADGGAAITRYDYEIDAAAGDFSAPMAQGNATDRTAPVAIAPLAAGDYKARSRAVNAAGAGAWSAPSAAAAVSGGGSFYHGWSPTIDLGTDGDYFVAPGGSDAGPGTFAEPFATIQKAIDTAKVAGGQKTIRVRAGTYREAVSLEGWSGAPGARNRLLAYGSERPVISGADILTGWVQCSAADADVLGATLGVAASPVWKVTIPRASIAAASLRHAYIVEAGQMLPIVYDRSADGAWPLSVAYVDPWWTATAFGTDVNGDIVSITHAGVIDAYTPAQLTRMWAAYLYNPHLARISPITGASGATVDFAATAGDDPDPGGFRYQLLNALPNMKQGQWGVVDNGDATVTFYLYPNNTANLAGDVEVFARNSPLNAYASHSEIAGFSLVNASGEMMVIVPTGGLSRLDDIAMSHIKIENGSAGVGGALTYVQSSDNVHLEHFTLRNLLGDGLSTNDVYWQTPPQIGVGLRVLYWDMEKIEHTPLQVWIQRDALIAYSRIKDCGWGIHSNIFDAFISCDRVTFWGLDIDNGGRYADFQMATRNVIGMSRWVGGGGAAHRDINSVGNGTELYHPSDNWWINNLAPTKYFEIGQVSPLGEHTYHVHNNIASHVWQKGSEESHGGGNLWTVQNPIGDIASDAAFDTIAAPADIFTDPAGGDYTFKPGSVAIGLGAKNLDAKLAELEALYGVNLHRDVTGVPFSTLQFVGPFASAYVADNAAPVLSAATAAMVPGSSGALDIGVTTDTGEGGIWWVLTTSASAPSAAQIAAGLDADGFPAFISGLIDVTAPGVFTLSPSGLAAETTYHIHFTHEDRAENFSLVATASATTDAAAVSATTAYYTPSGTDGAVIPNPPWTERWEQTSLDINPTFNAADSTIRWVEPTNSTAFYNRFWSLDALPTMPDLSNVSEGELYLPFANTTSSATAATGALAIRAAGDTQAAATGYIIESVYKPYGGSQQQLQLIEASGTGRTQLATVAAIPSTAPWINLGMRVNWALEPGGLRIKARNWKIADGEPGAWQIDHLIASPVVGGRIGLAFPNMRGQGGTIKGIGVSADPAISAPTGN